MSNREVKEGLKATIQLCSKTISSLEWPGVNGKQRAALVTFACGSVVLVFAARWCRRRRIAVDPHRSIRALKRVRQGSVPGNRGAGQPCGSVRSGSTTPGGSDLDSMFPLRGGSLEGSFRRQQNMHVWAELQRKSAIAAAARDDDKRSENDDAMTLPDGTPLAPQQLGLMGMEALETVIGYWEDALSAYLPKEVDGRRPRIKLTTKEEANFMRLLEELLETAYQLQEQGENAFINQNSILNRRVRYFHKSSAQNLDELNSVGGGGSVVDGSRSHPHELKSSASVIAAEEYESVVRDADGVSVSLDEDDFDFVSAASSVADLADFNDLQVVKAEADPKRKLYSDALNLLDGDNPGNDDDSPVPYRTIRTEFLGCESDAEFLAKLHCLRLAFRKIMDNESNRSWWIDSGRRILANLLSSTSKKDPKELVAAYDEIVDYLSVPENVEQMAIELKPRRVKCTNFYDVALDYLLIDSFEDLESPPSSVLAVMKNRWLSDGFKESALHTAIWSVLKAKRRLLQTHDGFKAKFYNLSEILIPSLAWGFFGPDENLNGLMNFFKDTTLDFVRSLYDFECVDFSTVDSAALDVMKLARERLGKVEDKLVSYAASEEEEY